MTPGWKQRWQQIIGWRESMLLAIEVHGPSIVYERLALLRQIGRLDPTGFKQVVQVLADKGMEPGNIRNLLQHGHSAGCACWRCIIKLHNSARRAQVKLTSAAGS